MKTIEYPTRKQAVELLKRPVFNTDDIAARVRPVLSEVKEHGDQALIAFTERFDHARVANIAVSTKEIAKAGETIAPELKEAIEQARKNIERFHAAQKIAEMPVETAPGVICWRKSLPIRRVGLYVPGGSSPLFSTLLMLGVPAKIAGCEDIIVCSPPQKDGKIAPEVLYACDALGITKIYKAGGAQAVAAMAYGTKTIPAVDKIFGPGNQYVTAAKQIVSSEGIAIDLPAGPSEVMVIADQTARPAFVAADLLSQAEHGPDSQVVLITTSKTVFLEVQNEVGRLKDRLSRQEIAEKALKHSSIMLVRDLGEAMELANTYAPEHLILSVAEPEEAAAMVKSAGSVFLGNFSPESAGDYASGTNHTLPTNGFATAFSGVSLDSFVKKVTFQHLTMEGLAGLAPVIRTMADAEGLDAHALAVEIRVKGDS